MGQDSRKATIITNTPNTSTGMCPSIIQLVASSTGTGQSTGTADCVLLLQELQQQQRQETDEESQQRLRRLGSVFASHVQAAESSLRAQRDSADLLLQRGAPDLFSACWAAVATPLRSGGPRPLERLDSLRTQQQQPQQQVGSHERALAAATNADGNAPGMSWRRWAFGGAAPHLPFPSAAAASSAAAEGISAAAGAADMNAAAEESRAAQMEAPDYGDIWGPLHEDELQEQQQQQQHAGEQQDEELLLQQDPAPLEGMWRGQKAPRRKGVSRPAAAGPEGAAAASHLWCLAFLVCAAALGSFGAIGLGHSSPSSKNQQQQRPGVPLPSAGRPRGGGALEAAGCSAVPNCNSC